MDTGRYRAAPLYLVSAAAGFAIGTILIAGIAFIVLGDAPRPPLGIGALAIPLLLTCGAVVACIAPARRARDSSATREASAVALADVARPEASAPSRHVANGQATLRRAA